MTFTTAELFKPISTIHSPAGTSWGNGTLYRGYLVLGFDIHEDSSGFQFWDISNPRSPKMVAQKYDFESKHLREIQGYSITTSYGPDYVVMPSHAGIEIWDFSDIKNLKNVSAVAMAPGGGAGLYNGIIFAFWQPPSIYCGGMNTGLYVVDAHDVKALKVVKQISTSTVNGKLMAGVFAVGNVLYATTTQDGEAPGAISTFDITDPANPVLMNSYKGTLMTEGGYTSYMNGNRVYAHGTSGWLQIFDVSDPYKIKRLGQATTAAQRGGYGMFQDGFSQSGMSDTYVKYDVRGNIPVEVGRCSVPGDNDWVISLGNMVFIGDDDGPESVGILAPHQTNPDKLGPVVNMANPKPGAVNQPLTTRVGFTFTDQIDFSSVSSSSFIVRPVGEEPLAGKYVTMAGASVVNFTPDGPLLTNTTYEIFLPAGGLKDFAGNDNPRATVLHFSTGGTVSLSHPTIKVGTPDAVEEIRNVLGRWLPPSRSSRNQGITRRATSGLYLRVPPEGS